MPKDTDHFGKIFWFICGVVFLVFTYIFLVTFFSIPKENTRNSDTSIAYLLGMMTTCAAFLVGSSPQPKKPEGTPGTTTADITVTKTEPANENAAQPVGG